MSAEQNLKILSLRQKMSKTYNSKKNKYEKFFLSGQLITNQYRSQFTANISFIFFSITHNPHNKLTSIKSSIKRRNVRQNLTLTFANR